MKSKTFFIVMPFVAIVLVALPFFCPPLAAAQSSVRKLPYENKESFVVTQGYNSPPTHINKDSYALDFSQNGCDAYGKKILAASSGKVWLVEESGYNGGYGTEILIMGDDNRVSRYAHLIQGSISVGSGDEVKEGVTLGNLGDTGLVVGAACAEHPGAHLHFAMYDKNADGSFSAHNPELISGYSNITEGKWYLSDNGAPATGLLSDIGAIMGDAIGSLFDAGGESYAGTASAAIASTSQNPSVKNSEAQTKITMEISSGGASPDESSVSPTQTTDLLQTNSNQAITPSSTHSQSIVVSSSAQITQNIPPSGGVSFSPSIPPLIAVASLSESSSVDELTSTASSSDELSESSSTSASDENATSSVGADTEASSTINIEDASGTSASSTQDSFATSTNPNPSESSDGQAGQASSTQEAVDNIASTTASSSDIVSSASSSNPIFSLVSPISVTGTNSIAIFNSSTLAIDFAWVAPQDASGSSDGIIYSIFDLDATSTDLGQIATDTVVASGTVPLWTGTSTEFSYSDFLAAGDHHFGIVATDIAGDRAYATTTVCIPDWFATVQSVDDSNSHWGWYGDNWYDLGTGFYGTLRALTLEGYINDSAFFASHLSIGEFLDSGYTQLNRQFTVSDNAPFTNVDAKITIGGLNIPFQPNKYYRLYTNQDFQNRSVILKGTTATGTAMWDMFVYGQGGVQYDYPFYPYLSWAFIPNFPPLLPPNSPSGISINFNLSSGRLDFSWSAATDPDTNQSLLTYQINCGTTPVPDASKWQSVGGALSASCVIDPAKDYFVSVRTVDDFGNISTPFTEEWTSPLTIPIAS
jgi:hypothetical protein